MDTGRFRLEVEVREVEEGIQRASQREDICFVSKVALRIRDLRSSLLNTEPQIVHLSGYGSGTEGIALENDDGDSVMVCAEALANLFSLHQKNV